MARKTIAEHKREFTKLVGTALSLVTARFVYVDTVQVLLRHTLSQAEARELQQMYGGKIPMERSRCFAYPFRLRLQQPSVESLKYLARIVPDHLVNRFDIPLDLIVPDVEAARGVQEFLRKHITQKWRGRRRLRVVQGTDYWAAPWKRRNLALYSNLPSKVCGNPAAHLEFRFYSAAVCRSYEVSQLKELLNFDPFRVISRNVRLSSLIVERVEENLDELTGQTMLRNNRRRGRMRTNRDMIRESVHNWCARLVQEGDRKPSSLNDARVQSCIDFLPKYMSRALIHLPPELLLMGAVWVWHTPRPPNQHAISRESAVPH